MRLVCPNCDAEYEVDASAIPDAGCDVQCSNCGHAWFQLSARAEEEMAVEEALFEPPPALTTRPAATSHDERAEPELPAPRPRALDESVLAVLREEAARESNARASEAPPAIETQGDLGLSAAVAATIASANNSGDDAPEADPVAQRIARMKGIDPSPAKPQTRREMLPEIDEINTSLRASNERRSGEPGAVAASLGDRGRKNAFRNGFVLMIVLAVILVVLYVMAPKLAQQIPGLSGALSAYVAAIDAGRIMLDDVLQSAIGLMRGGAGTT